MRASAAAVRARLEAWKSGDVYIVLLTITHEVLSEDIRVANNNEDITSQGYNWIGFPFKIDLPSEDDGPPKGQLAIQNVDRRIGPAILSMRGKGPARLRMQVVLSADPDDVWLDYSGYYLRDIRGNAMEISGVIDGWDFGREPWPSRRATQDRFPSLFR